MSLWPLHIADEAHTHADNYPTLAKLAFHYIALPALSGPVEELFSIWG